MLAVMRDCKNAGRDSIIVEAYALPVCKAVLAQARGKPMHAVALMRPALGEMYRLGGCHAQQDLLEQPSAHARCKRKAML